MRSIVVGYTIGTQFVGPPFRLKDDLPKPYWEKYQAQRVINIPVDVSDQEVMRLHAVTVDIRGGWAILPKQDIEFSQLGLGKIVS